MKCKVFPFMRFHHCFLVFVAGLFFGVSAASTDDPAYVLQRAKSFYKASKYDSTIAIVRSFLRSHGEDKYAQELVPILMESLMRKGDYPFSRRLFQIYIKRFPSSPFLPRLWYLEGIANIKGKEYEDALMAFSNALTGGVSPVIDSLILDGVQRLGEKVLTSDECSSLAQIDELNPVIQEILKYFDIVKLNQAGKVSSARVKAADFMKKFPRSPYISYIRDMTDKSARQQKGTVEIGVLAPLSGAEAEIGKQIAQGIQLAADRIGASAGLQIQLIMCDTRGNMLETARKVQELINEHHVPAIIGPVLSQDAIVAASTLVGKEIVMITPTATDDGIATLGSNIFQMNVPLGVLGARIARYAMDNLMIRDFVIFSPANAYGSALSKGFRDEVEKRGAEIVDEQIYEEGTKDFKEQFDKLRQKLNVRKQQRTALEKSLAGEKTRKPEPKNEKRYIPPEDTTLQVGGMFVPTEYEDAIMIAPQLMFHRIRAQLLGSTGWYNPKTISDGKDYVEDALISNNFQAGADNDREWLDFKSYYRTRYASDPERVAALGYDAASLVFQAIRERGGEKISASQIAQSLSSVKGYRGASGVITLDPAQRVNTEAAIMKIKDKQFIRVQ
jgi:ABC-type branched-subunit amino acid transport system substrate-binding protein